MNEPQKCESLEEICNDLFGDPIAMKELRERLRGETIAQALRQLVQPELDRFGASVSMSELDDRARYAVEVAKRLSELTDEIAFIEYQRSRQKAA